MRIRAGVHAMVVALLAALLLTGTVGTTGTATAGPAAAADDRPTAVVSLGDSAISGEGAGDYEPGTEGEHGDWCHRSSNALIHRTRLAATTINLACSGADSANVSLAAGTHYAEGSQAARLAELARKYRVTAVVLQVGANDDPAFADTILDCVKAWVNPFGHGCADALRTAWPDRLARMAPKVAAAIADVRTALRAAGYADDAYTFVLTSYASPLTEHMDRYLHGPQGCPIRLADAEYGRTEAVPQLAEALRGVAERAGVRFLDFSRATEGHEACSGSRDTEWQNRITVDPGALAHGGLDAIGIHLAQQSFHPNAAGHAELGRCVTEFVRGTATEAGCLAGPDGHLHAR